MRYARKWQRILGLQDWRLELTREPSEELAEVSCSLEARLAVISIGSDFWETEVTNRSLEETALHEMLHVLLFEFWAVTSNGAGPEEVNSAEHRVVNLLTKLLLAKETE